MSFLDPPRWTTNHAEHELWSIFEARALLSPANWNWRAQSVAGGGDVFSVRYERWLFVGSIVVYHPKYGQRIGKLLIWAVDELEEFLMALALIISPSRSLALIPKPQTHRFHPLGGRPLACV